MTVDPYGRQHELDASTGRRRTLSALDLPGEIDSDERFLLFLSTHFCCNRSGAGNPLHCYACSSSGFGERLASAIAYPAFSHANPDPRSDLNAFTNANPEADTRP
jgi:hypothetical protein